MKKLVLITILSFMLSPTVLASSNSFKTYTPPQHRNFHHKHHRHMPPPNNYWNNDFNNNWMQNRKYNNGTYYNYSSPYYSYSYTPRRSIFSSIKDFFSTGQMTGYTNSPDFDDIPSLYQNNTPSTPLFGDDGFKAGASVKILD